MRLSLFIFIAFVSVALVSPRANSAEQPNVNEQCANVSRTFSLDQQQSACILVSRSETTSRYIRSQAFATLGEIYIQKSEFGLAVAEYSSAIILNPDDPENFEGRAIARAYSGERDDAMLDFSEAIRLGPNARRFVSRGILKLQRNDFKGAKADALEAKRLDPRIADDPVWGKHYAELLLQDGGAAGQELTDRCINRDKTFSHEEQASACIQISRSDDIDSVIRGSAYALLGHLYLQDFLPEKAIYEFTQSINLDPDPHSFSGRGSARAFLGQFKNALADFDEAIRLDPEASAFAARGLVKFQMGNLGGARGDINEALRLDPSLAKDPGFSENMKKLENAEKNARHL